MNWIEVVFWVGILILFYSYIGYGLLLWILVKLRGLSKRRKEEDFSFLPEVTLVVAAYNEENIIIEKISNSLSLKYPEGKLKIIFITDGSSDRTPDIIRQYNRITLLHENTRRGKVAAMHRAMSFVEAPFVIFSDANTLLNEESILNIVRHYRNPDVGGVAGEKKIRKPDDGRLAGTEGLYWKYESALKNLDWSFYSVVGAAGELFSIRTNLYEYPGEHILLDDFIISMRICKKGYRVAYEPMAYAVESASLSLKEEQKRKIRISAGGFQSIIMLKDLLKFWRYPKLSFQYISHRVLRWTLCPLLLPVVLLFNVILVTFFDNPLYWFLLGMQLLFYLFAIGGWLLSLINIRAKLFYPMYYFVFINISLYLGFTRFIKKEQSVLWEKARREDLRPNEIL